MVAEDSPPQLKSGGFKSSNESSKHIVTFGPLRAFWGRVWKSFLPPDPPAKRLKWE